MYLLYSIEWLKFGSPEKTDLMLPCLKLIFPKVRDDDSEVEIILNV